MTQLKSVTAKLDLKAKAAKTKRSLTLPKLGTGDIGEFLLLRCTLLSIVQIILLLKVCVQLCVSVSGSRIENGRKPDNQIRIPSPIAKARQQYLNNYVPVCTYISIQRKRDISSVSPYTLRSSLK